MYSNFKGRSRCFWLMDNGELYTTGESSNGEMGIGTEQGDRNGIRVHV